MTEREYIIELIKLMHENEKDTNSTDNSNKDLSNRNDINGVKMVNEEKVEEIADIVAKLAPDMRYCDCIALVKKLIDLDLIKGVDNDIERQRKSRAYKGN